MASESNYMASEEKRGAFFCILWALRGELQGLWLAYSQQFVDFRSHRATLVSRASPCVRLWSPYRALLVAGLVAGLWQGWWQGWWQGYSLRLRAWEYTLQRFGGANSEALQVFETLMVLLFAEQFLD